jgi:Helix-turn-helix domain
VAKATLAKGSRISGAQRTTLASQYAKRYTGGESIRKIADDAGRSYGFVHNVLKESGVTLRGRGGATRGAKKKPAKQVVTTAKAAAKKPTAKKTPAKTTKKTAAKR